MSHHSFMRNMMIFQNHHEQATELCSPEVTWKALSGHQREDNSYLLNKDTL